MLQISNVYVYITSTFIHIFTNSSALQVISMHATRKAQLEVTFEGEEGHGSGVTNEFYSLVSEGLQRR
jgi:hypothetical protein